MSRLHQRFCGKKEHPVTYGCKPMLKALKQQDEELNKLKLACERQKRLKALTKEQRAERHLDCFETLESGDWGLAYE